jgi:hypothetical protein
MPVQDATIEQIGLLMGGTHAQEDTKIAIPA